MKSYLFWVSLPFCALTGSVRLLAHSAREMVVSALMIIAMVCLYGRRPVYGLFNYMVI